MRENSFSFGEIGESRDKLRWEKMDRKSVPSSSPSNESNLSPNATLRIED
jgi:hypothetical protein